MRYLGIDYGDKRIGIALSDDEGRIAFPKKVIANRGEERVLEELRAVATDEKVSEVVVGLPVSLDGRETEITKKALQFVDILRRELKLPIHLENEMFTTRMVHHAGVARKHVDEAAAALILQSYLDKRLATRN